MHFLDEPKGRNVLQKLFQSPFRLLLVVQLRGSDTFGKVVADISSVPSIS